MGNCWTGVSDDKLYQSEGHLLRSSSIPQDAYTIRNVQLDSGAKSDSDSQNYIHEIEVRGTRTDLPVLVMIHGYMLGGASFCKMLGHLRTHFHVYTIDLLGMGGSGRPQGVKCTTFDDSMDFFLTSIKRWTEAKQLNQDGQKFFLCGHSLGGMIAAHYALENPSQVHKLILLSAVGIPERPPIMQKDNFLNQRQSVASRYGAEWIYDTWPRVQFSPADFYRTVGYSVAKRLVNGQVVSRFKPGVFTDEQKDWFVEYFVQMAMRTKSTELLAFRLLAPMAYSEYPLCHKLPQLKIPVAFMYGDSDWMKPEVPQKLVAEGKVQGKVYITKESGHHLYAEAAAECAQRLIEFAEGQ